MNKEVFLPLQKARRNLAGIGKIWRCTLPDNAEKKPVRNKEVFLALRIDWRNWAGIRKICCCIPLETLWRNLACAKRNFLLEEPCQEQGRFDAVFSLAESDEDSWAISAEELSGKSCILAHVLIGAKFMLNSDWLDQTVLPYDWPLLESKSSLVIQQPCEEGVLCLMLKLYLFSLARSLVKHIR
jgi:hypothetical protein